MGKTIKSKEVIAYKGMKFDMTCKGFQYEVGKTYKTDKVKLCEYGFHACLNPIDVLDFYPKYLSSRYFKVLLSGEITKCDLWDTNVAATEITILEEIPADKFLTNTEWWKSENVIDLLYFSDGLARVRNCERKYNFIDANGKLLSDEWFNNAHSFKDGFAKVQRSDGLWNFITKDGKIISDEWFNYLDDLFRDGFAVVQRTNCECCKIDKSGKLYKD